MFLLILIRNQSLNSLVLSKKLNKMANFIVPIDFSDNSLKGLEIALIYARYISSNIQMVYVQKKSSDYSASMAEEHKYATQKFEEIIKEFSPTLINESKLGYIIKQGKIYEEVVNQAHSYNESIIATCTHGASGFEEIFIGSNTFKIIETTKRPVITIRKGEVPTQINNIVVPITANPESRQKVPYTALLAKFFNAKLHVVTECTGKSEKIKVKLSSYLKQITEYLEDKRVPFVTDELCGDQISDLTVNYASSINAELISITAEKESGLSLFGGSHAHEVINKANNCLVLNLSPRELNVKGTFRAGGG
jgi:nucleotide-binding universal stress UspA family protein